MSVTSRRASGSTHRCPGRRGVGPGEGRGQRRAQDDGAGLLPTAGSRSAGGRPARRARSGQVHSLIPPTWPSTRSGVVAGARRVQGRGHDSVVKPQARDPLQTSRRSGQLGQPGGRGRRDAGWLRGASASMKGVLGSKAVKEVAAGRKGIRTLFSKVELAVLQGARSRGSGRWTTLSIPRPITVFKLKIRPPELSMRIVAELWLDPDGSRILELCSPRLRPPRPSRPRPS